MKRIFLPATASNRELGSASPIFGAFQVLFLLDDMERIINIPLEYLDRAAKDPEFGDALALAMMIKANHGSSVFMDFSLRRLQSVFHVNFQHLSKTVKNAIKFGLLIIKEYKTVKEGERTDLVAPKIPRGDKFVRIHVCDSNYGVQMYLESKTQDNNKIYSQSTKRQTLKDVYDLLLLAALTVRLTWYSDKYDAEKWQNLGMKRHAGKKCVQKAAEEESKRVTEENILNTGFSYDRMVDMFEGVLTRYKMRMLVKKGKDEGLFTSRRHDRIVKDDDLFTYSPDPTPQPTSNWLRGLFEASVKAYADEFRFAKIAYNRLETVAPLYKRCYRGTILDGNTPMPVWFMRMGNSYHTCCDIIGKRRSLSGRRSVRTYNRDHVR